MRPHRFPGCTPPFAACLAVLVISGCAARAATPSDHAEINYADIAEIRTIDGLSISPDGRYAAYRVVTPSVAENRIVEQWYRVPIDGGTPEALGDAAEPIMMPLHDVLELEVSQWNADSSAIYVRRLAGPAIEIHRLAPGAPSIPAVADAANVESFTLDGTVIRYQVRAPRAEIDARQAKEAREGVHFGTSVFSEGLPMTRSTQTGTREPSIRRLGAIGAVEAYAGPLQDKVAVITGDRGPAVRATALSPSMGLRGPVHGSGGLDIVFEAVDAPDPLWIDHFQRNRIVARGRGGKRYVCTHAVCEGRPESLFFATFGAGGEVVIARRDIGSKTTFYGWTPRSNMLRTVASPGSLLDGGGSYKRFPCPATARFLVCVEAGTTRPPRLVRIDLASGAVTQLANPNAGLAEKPHIEARYLTWTDTRGRESSGYLVLPPVRTGPVPLVITTTICRGYLRGGAVPLAPEQILARRGMAALCVSASDEGGDARRPDGKPVPLALHDAALAAYKTIISQLAAEGTIDPARVAITGHSFGAIIAAHVITHSDLFSAAVMGTGITTDPAVFTISAPHADSPRALSFHGTGLPAPEDDPDGIWASVSPSLNVARIKAAVLMQPPEDEWLMALPLFSALDRSGGTVDMYVYPRAGHMLQKYPSHVAWRLRRSVEWLAFWLLGEEAPDGDTAQYVHWRALRDKKDAARPH